VSKHKQQKRVHYDIAVTAPKPNPGFTEWQTAITKFLTYFRPVKCAYCGRISKHHWTQLKFFRIVEGFEHKRPDGKVVEGYGLVARDGAELFPPLTPVCRKHILSPEGGAA
jgi:hypothetical protein